ncbi:MAG: esterase family protein [Acidobacteria bacterium]|nr:esterase family protein [Acidobacteriota bacterium]
MTNNRTRVLSLLLVCLFSLAARAQAPATAPARWETVKFESKLAGKTLPYNVVLPEGYALPANRGARYPVLYLLHGFTGHYADWLSRTRLADYAARHQMIVVTPEGNNGWYTDSASAPADKYESYVVKELIPDVQRRYRTDESRGGRAVAGLSMGGYGALKFGVKYPEMFALAASMSGAVAIASYRGEDELPAGYLRTSVAQTFGPVGGATKDANDLFKLLRELTPERVRALPFFYLDCGTEDSLRLLPSNRALADLLAERKIPHEYRQLPGDHNWAYWDKQVQEVLRLAGRMTAARAAAAPAR